jgi:type I restriction-modification system DNA methylase subunit
VNGQGLDTWHKSNLGRDSRNHVDFISSVADLLRDDYKQSEYLKVILPLTVLRWLDEVLAPTKQPVLETHKQLQRSL